MLAAGAVLLLLIILVTWWRRTNLAQRRRIVMRAMMVLMVRRAAVIANYRQRRYRKRKPGRLGSQFGRRWKQPRQSNIFEDSTMHWFLNHADDAQFRARFRVPRTLFNTLKAHLSGTLEPDPASFRNDEVYPPEAIAACLHFMGSTGGLRDTADVFNRGETTIKKHTVRVCEAIIATYGPGGPHSVMTALTADELAELVNDLDFARDLPQCVGALDGKHFFVKSSQTCIHMRDHVCT